MQMNDQDCYQGQLSLAELLTFPATIIMINPINTSMAAMI
jgi:hypothetical protein